MKIYPQWFIEELHNESDKELARSGWLMCSTQNQVEFDCPIHGVYTQGVGNHIKISTGEKIHGCPFCSGNQSYDQESIRIETRVRKDGVRRDQWGLYKCEEHNLEYWQQLSNHKKGALGCPECVKISRSMKRHAQMLPFPDWMLEEVSDEDRIRLINKDVNMTEKMNFYCKKHGWYSQKVSNHIYRKTGQPHMGCPKCVAGGFRSKAEKQVEAYVVSLGLELGPRKGLLEEGMELDIYVPSCNAAIEVDGSTWHTEGEFDPYGRLIPIGYHAHKDELAAKLGIRVLHIKDGMWCTSDRSKNYKTKKLINEFLGV